MKVFPITSISNFFDDPDEVVKFAKSLKYTTPKEGIYPGVRTENLSKIDYAFFNKTILSILSVYYEDYENIDYSQTYLGFQKIKPYSKSFEDVRNKGWIHRDDTALGGLIYLNKQSYPESGTSMYTLKKEPVKNKVAVQTKLDFYGKNKFNLNQFKKEMASLEKQFVKTHTFKNIYNTLVAFDGNQWHNVDNLYCNSKEDRLTLVFFIHKIQARDYPKLRLDKIQSFSKDDYLKYLKYKRI